MTANELMDAVEMRVREVYPKDPIYRDILPKDFKRPSFTLECQKDDEEDANAVLVRRSVTLLLTCFTEVNAYSDSSRNALNERLDQVMGLFRTPIFVQGRALLVQARKGSGDPQASEVSLTFHFMDGRISARAEDEAPNMEHFTFRKDG